jgi:hypothetical protein
MLHTKQKTLSLVCNSSNKLQDGRYKIPMGSLSGEGVVGVSLKKVVFRNLFYNVVGSGKLQNNTFYFTIDNVLKTVVISEGFYNINQLLPLVESGVQQILNTYSPTPNITMVYSGISGKITATYLSNGGGTIFQLRGGEFFDSINLSLGNSQNIIFNGLLGTPRTFKDIINISGEDSCGLVIEEISKGSGLSNSEKDNFGATSGLLTTLSFKDAPFGQLGSYHNPNLLDTMLLYESPQNLSSLTIYLQTASGIILDLGVSDLHLELLLYLN